MFANVILIFVVQFLSSCYAKISIYSDCHVVCPPEDAQCAFNAKNSTYTLFSSKCAMAAYSNCHNVDIVQTPLSYCMKNQRRNYGESCPVFCPNFYSPVCGASRYRSYKYRTFNNGCYLDMLNCRGDEDVSSYVEVPLEFCQNHLMKNIFKEQVVVSNIHDYDDYD